MSRSARPDFGWRAALMLAAALLASGASRANDAPVTLDLHLRFIDSERRPIAQLPLRVRVGTEVQKQAGGMPVVTDATGAARASVRLVLDQRLKKMPTHFAGSLLSLPQKVVHVQLGLELDGFGLPWLLTLDADRFNDGTVASPAEFTAWPADASGRHAAPLRWQRQGPVDSAELPDGRHISALPWRPDEYVLAPVEGEAGRWTLSLVVMRRGVPR